MLIFLLLLVFIGIRFFRSILSSVASVFVAITELCDGAMVLLLVRLLLLSFRFFCGSRAHKLQQSNDDHM